MAFALRGAPCGKEPDRRSVISVGDDKNAICEGSPGNCRLLTATYQRLISGIRWLERVEFMEPGPVLLLDVDRRDAAEAIAARRSGRQPDPLALWFPNERDGAIGVKFVEAAVASSDANGAWTDARLSLKEKS
jgi:hypothetical protein